MHAVPDAGVRPDGLVVRQRERLRCMAGCVGLERVGGLHRASWRFEREPGVAERVAYSVAPYCRPQ